MAMSALGDEYGMVASEEDAMSFEKWSAGVGE